MRITFVLPEATLSGGVRVVAMHAARLEQRGHQVIVISTPPRPVTMREALRRVKHGKWPLAAPAPSHLDGLNVEHRRLERYRPVVASDVPDSDVVVATWWQTAEWVADLPAHKGAKVYLIQHDERAMYPSADPEAQDKRRRVMSTWRLPMYRIVVAQWLARLLEHLGTGAAHVVPNGVDLAHFHAPPRGKQPRPTVGVMYATVRFKGCDVSLAACELARRQLPELRLIAFGSEDPVRHLPLPAGTMFAKAPSQARIREMYAACDAWLFASRSEGFGLPLLESMACRTPVIATSAGAAPELVAGGGGMLVASDDAEEMAAAIERVAAMAGAEWREMSDAALATAQRNGWDHSTDLFEAALQKAVMASEGRTAMSASVVKQ